jgi:hypothetical protein
MPNCELGLAFVNYGWEGEKEGKVDSSSKLMFRVITDYSCVPCPGLVRCFRCNLKVQ